MNTITLSELNGIILECLDRNLNPSYWVIAEISELRVNQKGHCYLELIEKQDDEVLAKSRATIWSYAYRNLSLWFEAATGQPLQTGMKILANVTVGFHQVYGLSLNIRDIDASFTIGERARKRLEIMKKLEEEGVAGMNKEIPLPLVPQNIAVISAPTAAGYQDFTDQLDKNIHNYDFRVRLFPALMQGKEAESSIVNALHAIFKSQEHFDIVVMIRGGGASADLDCFDSYRVASHVAQFPIPVITGIGHERDETLVDWVANTRLKTPTAAAEFLISGLKQFEDSLDENLEEINGMASEIISGELMNIDNYSRDLKHLATRLISETGGEFHLLKSRLGHVSKNRVNQMITRTIHAGKLLQKIVQGRLVLEHETFRRIGENLKLMDKSAILKRGFTITRKNGKLIRDPASTEPGEEIQTEFYKGTMKSIVKK